MSSADDRRRAREAQLEHANVLKTGTPAEIISALSSVQYQGGRVEVTSRMLASGPRKGETIYSLHVHPRTHRDPSRIKFSVRSNLYMRGFGDLVDSGRTEIIVHTRGAGMNSSSVALVLHHCRRPSAGPSGGASADRRR